MEVLSKSTRLIKHYFYLRKMTLETPRLTIFPLRHEQMLQFIVPNELENALGFEQNNRVLPEKRLQKIVGNILPKTAGKENIQFDTFWMIVLRSENTIAAELCFKGKPDNAGEVEIGYETYEAFRDKGIMAEAVTTIAEWAFSETEVKIIRAETDPGNTASQRTLQKAGFTLAERQPGNLIWKKSQ